MPLSPRPLTYLTIDTLPPLNPANQSLPRRWPKIYLEGLCPTPTLKPLLGEYQRCTGTSDLRKRVVTSLRPIYTLPAVSDTKYFIRDTRPTHTPVL